MHFWTLHQTPLIVLIMPNFIQLSSFWKLIPNRSSKKCELVFQSKIRKIKSWLLVIEKFINYLFIYLKKNKLLGQEIKLKLKNTKLKQNLHFRSAHKSSKKLLEQCQKLDKIWGHTFSAVITLTTPESWYRKLRELIDRQQQGPLWMSQTKVIYNLLLDWDICTFLCC